MLVAAIVLSVLVGVSLGLLGGGGSILAVPLLVYVARVDVHVAIGMSLAFDLSVQLGHCDAAEADLVRRHLAAIGLPTTPAHALGNVWSAEELIAHMGKDKKVVDGTMTFILARAIGDAFISRDVTHDDLMTLFEGTMNT